MKQNAHRSSKGNASVKPSSAVKVGPFIEPWLKDFLDTVIIPALLRELLKSDLATGGGMEAQSPQETPRGDLE